MDRQTATYEWGVKLVLLDCCFINNTFMHLSVFLNNYSNNNCSSSKENAKYQHHHHHQPSNIIRRAVILMQTQQLLHTEIFATGVAKLPINYKLWKYGWILRVGGKRGRGNQSECFTITAICQGYCELKRFIESGWTCMLYNFKYYFYCFFTIAASTGKSSSVINLLIICKSHMYFNFGIEM